MSEPEYIKLKERVIKGTAWLRNITEQGEEDLGQHDGHIQLLSNLRRLLKYEELTRANKGQLYTNHEGYTWYEQGWHSKIWIQLREKEKLEDDRRSKAKERREELAARKRAGIN